MPGGTGSKAEVDAADPQAGITTSLAIARITHRNALPDVSSGYTQGEACAIALPSKDRQLDRLISAAAR